MASASFSTAVPTDKYLNIGHSEFASSTHVTFYYMTIESKPVKDEKDNIVRREYYGYYITKCIKDLSRAARYDSNQFELEGRDGVGKPFDEIPARYTFQLGDEQDIVI